LYTTVPPMIAPTITGATPLSNTSFTVSWTINNPNYNYMVTWTNLRTNMTESITLSENANVYTVRGLDDDSNYNVSVATTNNSCGMMESDPITVYGKK